MEKRKEDGGRRKGDDRGREGTGGEKTKDKAAVLPRMCVLAYVCVPKFMVPLFQIIDLTSTRIYSYCY